MARPRLELHAIFEELLGSKNVYYQPPESKKLNYPCIIYERDMGDTVYADDSPYVVTIRYSVTLIDKNPDSEFVNKLSQMQMSTWNRHYTIDNLNHDVFYIYY